MKKQLLFGGVMVSTILASCAYFNLPNFNTNLQSQVKSQNVIKLPIKNIYRGSTKVNPNLEKIIIEQYLDGIISNTGKFDTYFDTYFANLNGNKGGYGKVLRRALPYLGLIQDLEKKLCLIEGFRLLPGIETDFGRDTKSITDVEGFVQMTEDAKTEIIRLQNRDEMYIKQIFPQESLAKMQFTQSSVDQFLSSLNFKALGYDESRVQEITRTDKISETMIKRVILPRYLLFKKVFPNGIDRDRVDVDVSYSIKAAACYYLSNVLELSSLRLYQREDGSRFLNYSMKGTNVFEIEHYIASYNLGSNPIKKLAKLVGFGIKNNFLDLLDEHAEEVIPKYLKPKAKAKEVRIHLNRKSDYSLFFKQLEKIGILS